MTRLCHPRICPFLCHRNCISLAGDGEILCKVLFLKSYLFNLLNFLCWLLKVESSSLSKDLKFSLSSVTPPTFNIYDALVKHSADQGSCSH